MCQSTNTSAQAIATSTNIVEGIIVITDHQKAGKGQRGNIWESEPYKNLTFSLILQPTFLRIEQQFSLNIAVSLGIWDALYPKLDDLLCIKWSNDMFFGNHKLGGILIENSIKGQFIKYSIVGIGLNIHQTQFHHHQAISMKNITNQDYTLQSLLDDIVYHIEVRYLQLRQSKFDVLKKTYEAKLYRYQQNHTFRDTTTNTVFNGEIQGVDCVGKLIVKTNQGQKTFGFKEIQFV